MTTTQVLQAVSTSEFEFCHGKRPSGHGYWGFEVTYSKRSGFSPSQFWVTALYSEAKKQFAQNVVEQSNYTGTPVKVQVLP